MDAERLRIAREFAVDRRFRWLPGMREADGDRVVAVGERDVCLAEEGATCDDNLATWVPQSACVPDLDDDLTRLGLLAVVRAAHKDPSIGITKAGDEWCVTMAYVEIVSGDARTGILRRGPTEEAALLAALQAAS